MRPPVTPHKKIDCKETKCYHCGNQLGFESIYFENHAFCCEGCKTVFSILKNNQLDTYYELNKYPGYTRFTNKIYLKAFEVLNEPSVEASFLQYKSPDLAIARFYIPAIHCTSCIWLLENINTIEKNIVKSIVNFNRKEAYIYYNPKQISLKDIAILLARLGYEPHLSLNDLNKQVGADKNRAYYYKLAVSFFALGNIMLLAFPEYLGMDIKDEPQFSKLFGYLSILLSLPVVFYSAQDFIKSAWSGIKLKTLNIDFPIALGILVMFIRSVYEILTQSGPGYLDTLASLVFLMLVGRRFQNLSYDKLSFERDYKSYFPLSVTKLINDTNKEEKQIPLSDIKTGDRLLIRSQEIIPADSILLNGQATIDYSFVTGEEKPISVVLGEIIYAGGKQIGGSIEVEVIKPVSQSYLTQLWNDQEKNNKIADVNTITNRVSKYFSIVVFILAVAALMYWWNVDRNKAVNAFTAVLIITCPCALALSAPFAFGYVVRGFGRMGFYVKNSTVIELLSKCSHIVFDKTGTLTSPTEQSFNYQGIPLTNDLMVKIGSICKNSSHPLSRKIATLLKQEQLIPVDEYIEITGKGIISRIGNQSFCIGSATFIEEQIGLKNNSQKELNTSAVYLAINQSYYGYFEIKNKYRSFIQTLFNRLKTKYALYILSGDNDSERSILKEILPTRVVIEFNQTPFDKKNFLNRLVNEGKKVIMIGDGLNDSGALKAATVGIAVTDDINNFTPASDAILEGDRLYYLPLFLRTSKTTMQIITVSFIISFIYNLVGLFFAIQGTLTPLIAAILMPISSVTVVLFITLAVKYHLRTNYSTMYNLHLNK